MADLGGGGVVEGFRPVGNQGLLVRSNPGAGDGDLDEDRMSCSGISK